MKRAVAAVAVASVALAGAAAGHAGEGDRGGNRVGRVLVVSLPHVSWADLESVELPHLVGFFREAAVADLSARASTDRRTTRLGDGYITLGAGTRAIGDGSTDGQGLDVGEPFGFDTAGSVFGRRTGRDTARGIVQLGIAQIIDRNAALLLDADPGALGEALAGAGYSRAVIANGDGVEPEGVPPEFRRQAVSALMDGAGTVPEGRVDGGLLRGDPRAPYGVRYDDRAVLAAFRDAWRPRSVVLVEASDLVRADSYRDVASPEQREALVATALRQTDDLFAALMADVDLDRDAVLVVGPAHGRSEPTLTAAAMRGPGVAPGLLRSATTRRSGFVQLYDVAPTILDLLGVDRPSSMAGRPFEVGRRGGSWAERIDFLVDSDEAARFIAGRVEPVALALIAAHGVLVIAFALWLVGRLGGRAVPGVLGYGGLVVLGVIPAVFLARLVPFHELGAVAYWVFLAVTSLALAAAYRGLGRGHEFDPVILAVAAIAGLLVVDVLVGSPLQISSALGNSPIVAGRFTGFGNLAYSALASAGLVLAVLLASRLQRPAAACTALAVLVTVVVVDGAPFWGSDVGGLLSMTPAFLVTSVLLLRFRLRARTAFLAASAAVAGVVGFGLLDLARPANRRTHLGRLFERIGDEGWSGFVTVVRRKLDANLEDVTTTAWLLVLPIALVLIITIVRAAPGNVRHLTARFPALRAGAVGALVLLVLGFGLNDSGVKVPAIMLTVMDAAAVVILSRSGTRAAGTADGRRRDAVHA